MQQQAQLVQIVQQVEPQQQVTLVPQQQVVLPAPDQAPATPMEGKMPVASAPQITQPLQNVLNDSKKQHSNAFVHQLGL